MEPVIRIHCRGGGSEVPGAVIGIPGGGDLVRGVVGQRWRVAAGLHREQVRQQKNKITLRAALTSPETIPGAHNLSVHLGAARGTGRTHPGHPVIGRRVELSEDESGDLDRVDASIRAGH